MRSCRKALPIRLSGILSKLRAYAKKLTRNGDLIDDLVQETVMRALVYSDQFIPGTNLSAWLYTILRHCYFSELRRAKRFSTLNEEPYRDRPAVPSQIWALEAKELAKHVAALPNAQREALTLVAVEGNSYDAAANKVGCPAGTMKSRVSRARAALFRAVDALDQANNRPDGEQFFRHDLDHLDNVA